jgi:hypothetical protein
LSFSKPKIVSKTTKNAKPHMSRAILSSDLLRQPADPLPNRYASPSDDIDGPLVLSQIHESPLAVTPNTSSPSRLGSSRPRSISVKSTDGLHSERAPGNDEISSRELRIEDKDIVVMTKRDNSTTLEDRAQSGEQRSSFGGLPTTPSKKPPPSYSYRNLIGMASLNGRSNTSMGF